MRSIFIYGPHILRAKCISSKFSFMRTTLFLLVLYYPSTVDGKRFNRWPWNCNRYLLVNILVVLPRWQKSSMRESILQPPYNALPSGRPIAFIFILREEISVSAIRGQFMTKLTEMPIRLLLWLLQVVQQQKMNKTCTIPLLHLSSQIL